MAVGKTSLGKFLSRISTVAGCSGKYTNHCLPALTVTTLKHSGVSNGDICSETGHKREENLRHYCKEPSENKKRELSRILFEKSSAETSSRLGSNTAVSNVQNQSATSFTTHTV